MKITPYPDNAKKHPKGQIDKIAASIKRFGMNQPIVVDKQGFIIVGHGRYLALQQLGWEVKPEWVKQVTNLTDDEVKAYRLADNRLNESDWDISLVIEELHNLKEVEEELANLTGFGDLKLDEVEDEEPVDQTGKEPKINDATCPECGHYFEIDA